MSRKIIIAGSGPAGMASALALRVAGHDVQVYERGETTFALGGLINLWSPAVKALRDMGVDITDIGMPDRGSFWNASDKLRVDVKFDPAQVEEFGGYFFGMLRPDLYQRIRDALPPDTIVPRKGVTGYRDLGDEVEVTFTDGTSERTPLLIGADGLHSVVRRQLLGDTQIRDHHLHVLQGYTFDIPEGLDPRQCVVRHSRTVQGSWAGVRTQGRDAIAWYFVEAWDPAVPRPTGDALLEHCKQLAKEFPTEQQQLVESSEPGALVWPIRDLGDPPDQWSKGRVVIAGDAAHATSPYAAYGAGMSIVDGYFLGQQLAGVDLSDTAALRAGLLAYQEHRIAHTRNQVKQAYMLGRLFHHSSALVRPIRDFMLDHTNFLQRQVGEKSPGEIAAQLTEMGPGILVEA